MHVRLTGELGELGCLDSEHMVGVTGLLPERLLGRWHIQCRFRQRRDEHHAPFMRRSCAVSEP